MKLTTAKTTGFLYLGLAVSGIAAFLFANQKLYVDNNAAATAQNLVNNVSLARFGIAAELALVVLQALTGVWFYKLFRKKDSFTASLIAVFGMVNAVAIMIASAMWLGALNSALQNYPDQSQLLYNVHQYIWTVSNLFFGLWLIPMGIMAKKYKFPTVLAWILIFGGVGYVLSAFTAVILPDEQSITDLITMPATIGEFWIIGYLLVKNPRNL